MKKSLLALVAFSLSFHLATAQDDPAKLAKSAGKALTSYNIDPANNGAKLEEARTKIDEALKSPEIQATANAWLTKGDIYNTMLQNDLSKQMIDKNAPITGDNNALVAFEAYKMALNAADIKKYQKGDALKGIGEVQGSLINIGVTKYEKGEYAKAYNSFSAALTSHDLLKAGEKKSLLDDKAQYENQVYITGLTAMLAGDLKNAVPIYESIYKSGNAKADVYSGLYKAKLEMKDTAAADVILKEGRAKFPDDAGLLFDEINAYLIKGKLSELTGSLKSAIAKEPTNVTLYVTLGNVYDNLYQRENAAKNEAKSKEYADEALKYYQEAVKIDPKNVDAHYATGALFYNKAALLTQELNAMPEDFSAAGMKKYNDLKGKIEGLFKEALPHFKKAETLDPNDMNTLIALSEIFARQDELELMKEFKGRLETVKSGGKNAASYFK
jgi:tetratricopeptide (TPR) repeat protein